MSTAQPTPEIFCDRTQRILNQVLKSLVFIQSQTRSPLGDTKIAGKE